MTVEIKSIPVDEKITSKTKWEKYDTIISADSYEKALKGLVEKINDDWVDTENCYLQVVTS